MFTAPTESLDAPELAAAVRKASSDCSKRARLKTERSRSNVAGDVAVRMATGLPLAVTTVVEPRRRRRNTLPGAAEISRDERNVVLMVRVSCRCRAASREAAVGK